MIISLFSTLVRLHLECQVQLQALHHEKDTEMIEQVQGKAAKLLQDLENNLRRCCVI